MNLPEPQSVTFTALFAAIEKGTIKIPQFQRDFVWSKAKSAKLLDSIVKGYPIGTFILWKTNERLRSIRNLGGVSLPETPKGDAVEYVLDGQQRLTSLFVTLKGLTVERDEQQEDFSQFWVDLRVSESEEIILMDSAGRDATQPATQFEPHQRVLVTYTDGEYAGNIYRGVVLTSDGAEMIVQLAYEEPPDIEDIAYLHTANGWRDVTYKLSVTIAKAPAPKNLGAEAPPPQPKPKAKQKPERRELVKQPEQDIIQLKDLLSGDFAYLASFPKDLQAKIRTYKNNIESYQFSAILMKDAAIDVATEVFTRLNTGGQPLSVFEIMVAKTYDPEKNFDLAEKFGALITDLESAYYDTLSSATVLQTVAVLIRKDCRKKEILNLPKHEVIKTWPKAVDAIRASVDYFRSYYRIPVSRLLPYPGLIIPIAHFFYKHRDKPTGDRQKFLQDFFWRVSLGGRYSQSLESRIAQDIGKIDQILKGRLPTYDWAVDVTPEFIEKNGYFSTSRSFVKAILCVLAHKEPKSFVDNSIVRLDNSYLKQANSKNYHHFFPKSWLEKQGEDRGRINHVANITLVDDFLNKRLIRAQSPKTYMKEFISKNPDIEKCLSTHLIKLNSR